MAPYQITLAPWEARVVDILSEIVGAANGALHTTGGISIEHNGDPGHLIARMYIARPNVGYSATSVFVDPENTLSQRWHGSGFRFRNLDGEKLKAGIALRNVGNQLSRVKGKILYTKLNGEVASIALPERQIAAGDSRVFDLSTLIDNANVSSSVDYGGVEIEYDTPKGTLLASVQSGSPNGEHVFQVPMFDPQKTPSSAGGYPWKADGDYATIVYIKNETGQPERFTASLLFAGGGYTLGLKDLKPNQTLAVDFKKLRDSQIPDVNGNLIPLTLEKGQIAWSHTGPTSKALSGRSEQISVSSGFASTYDCRNYCQDEFYEGWIDPGSLFAYVGDFASYQAEQQDMNSYGQLLPPYPAGSVNWNSSDPDVAEIAGYSQAEGVSGGTSMIQASWTAYENFGEVGGGYDCPQVPVYVFLEAPMEVRPRITSISPASGVVGMTTNVTINGTGFRNGASVAGGAGITVSNVSFVSASRITADFAIAANATGGNQAVSVTVRGQTSNTSNFFVQIPTKARRDEFPVIVIREPNPGDFINIFGDTVRTNVCGAYRNVKYTLLDQAGNPILQEVTVNEILTDFKPSDPSIPPPAAESGETIEGEGSFGDLVGVAYAPPCNVPAFSFTLKQAFSVAFGQTTYNLTTKNDISVAKTASAQWTINVTITTP